MKKLLLFFAGVALFGLVSCNKDEEPSYNDVTLKVGATYTIPGDNDAEWESSNDFIAYVEEGVVYADLAGTVTISSELGSFIVTVVATNNVVKEPCLEWGYTQAAVKSFMNSYNCVLDEETEDELTYVGSGNVFMYDYEFEDNALVYSVMFVSEEKVSMEEMAEFVDERYIYIDSDEDGDIYLISPEGKTIAVLGVEDFEDGFAFVMIYGENTNDSNDYRAAAVNVKAIMKAKMEGIKINKVQSKALETMLSNR